MVSRELRCHGVSSTPSSPGKAPLHALPVLRGSDRMGSSFLDLHLPHRHSEEAEGSAAAGNSVKAVPGALAGV